MCDVLLIHAVVNFDTAAPKLSDMSEDIGAIIGGAVAMVFILSLAVAVVVIASIALVLRRRKTQPQ